MNDGFRVVNPEAIGDPNQNPILERTPQTLGLIVLLRNGPDYTLASRYIHNDEDALNESIERVRKLMADNPDTFRAGTEIAVGEVTIRDPK